jgi:IS5 family transposase
VGADKGYFAKSFLTALCRRRIRPPIAAKTIGRAAVHQRVRRLSRTVGYRLLQHACKKIEELWGEAKCWHGFRRFRRRGLLQVRDEAYLIGWLLNLKRLATLLPAPA